MVQQNSEIVMFSGIIEIQVMGHCIRVLPENDSKCLE